MKWLSVVGARPQFIKLAPLCEAVTAWNEKHPDRMIEHRIIHTGQHYDEMMSDRFFQTLSLPRPDYALDAGSGTHAEQTARIMVGVEQVLMKKRFDMAVLYGDTNSTLAGALAAAKLAVPIAHIEAGLRSYQRHMPEEINRVATDHLSSVLFCPTALSCEQLAREGIRAHVHISGDIMYDVLKKVVASEAFALATVPEALAPKSFLLLTLHRAETTADSTALLRILDALDDLAAKRPVLFPVHPRTKKLLESLQWRPRSDNFHLIAPLSYQQILKCAQQAALVLTDSGGLQKEAYWLKTPCITLRETTEWQELVEAGWNATVGLDADRLKKAIVSASDEGTKRQPWREIYGNGTTATFIVARLAENREA